MGVLVGLGEGLGITLGDGLGAAVADGVGEAVGDAAGLGVGGAGVFVPPPPQATIETARTAGMIPRRALKDMAFSNGGDPLTVFHDPCPRPHHIWGVSSLRGGSGTCGGRWAQPLAPSPTRL